MVTLREESRIREKEGKGREKGGKDT